MSEASLLNHRLGFKNYFRRLIWSICWLLFVKPFPRTLCNSWKLLILRLFGAKVAYNAIVYSSAHIYDPQNLIMEKGSCIGPEVDCYNVDIVKLCQNAIVSQKSFLCTASHSIDDFTFKLITAPILIEENAWVAADSFVGMGVTVGKYSVVGARASVFKDVLPYTIVGGNPAKFIKKRLIK
jgi:putative colanic acid biosynthesis acetyltransferase WcaF